MLILVVVVGAIEGRAAYCLRIENYASNDGERHEFYIRDTITADSLMAILDTVYTPATRWCWRRHAKQLHFTRALPGHYTVEAKISDRSLINMFLYGHQTPVRLSWRSTIRTREQLASRLARQLRCDSVDIISRLDSNAYLAQYGLKRETAVCLFIPDTYEVWWTMTADELFERMYKEYNRFWNDERRQKAVVAGLTPTEVATLASIVASETNKEQEYPIIAGLYLNRLRKGMLLQACPTVIFAVGDFSLRRVTNRHLKTESPYNTYRHPGLPPGPIRCVSATVLDAVLNYQQSNYLYMCANPDFSGTHKFSSSYAEHAKTAREYQRELNKRKIK